MKDYYGVTTVRLVYVTKAWSLKDAERKFSAYGLKLITVTNSAPEGTNLHRI